MGNDQMKHPSNWTIERSRVLVVVWGRADVQACIDGSIRDAKVYNRISADYAIKGYERNAAQVKIQNEKGLKGL